MIGNTTKLLTTLSAAALLVTGCGQSETDTTAQQANSVVIREHWVKAADSGMTAAFAELQNTGGTDVHVVSASSSASTRVELHEMATGPDGAMVMRPKDGGFVIPAGGTHVLAAGGDHLMLMDVTTPLTPGTDAEFTLEFEDSSTTTFEAQVRDFAGAQENYVPGHGEMSMEPGKSDSATHGG